MSSTNRAYMELIRGLHNLNKQFAAGGVFTIGNYDGIHLGHQQILKVVKQKADQLALSAGVIIFEPLPEEVLKPGQALRLSPLREKLCLFASYGIDQVVLLPFNPTIAKLTANQFIDKVLLNQLHLKHLVVGDDFYFGYQRQGDFNLLQLKAAANFQLTSILPFKIDGVRVSSTLIRKLLGEGRVELANKFLGRPYQFSGMVVKGEQVGRKLGFPTANIHLKYTNLPLSGVFLVQVDGVAKDHLLGLANFGYRPTVSGRKKLLEVYSLDVKQNIYGQRVVLKFFYKIRDEQKFISIEQLRKQIEQDLLVAKTYCNRF